MQPLRLIFSLPLSYQDPWNSILIYYLHLLLRFPHLQLILLSTNNINHLLEALLGLLHTCKTMLALPLILVVSICHMPNLVLHIQPSFMMSLQYLNPNSIIRLLNKLSGGKLWKKNWMLWRPTAPGQWCHCRVTKPLLDVYGS